MKNTIKVSSSIDNFISKLNKRTGFPRYKYPKNFFDNIVFFGMYHLYDYIRLLVHRGNKKVFWCGSDILHLSNNSCKNGNAFWRFIIPKINAKHYCENEVEQKELLKFGINAKIAPMIFDDPDKFSTSFIPSWNPHVYISCHPEHEERYGVNTIRRISCAFPEITFHVYGIEKPTFSRFTSLMRFWKEKNIIYHGLVKSEEFDEDIKKYHCALRLVEFDGFSEITAKSALMAQYPISTIKYHYISNSKTMKHLLWYLMHLKYRKEPNIKMQTYWRETLKNNLQEVLYG